MPDFQDRQPAAIETTSTFPKETTLVTSTTTIEPLLSSTVPVITGVTTSVSLHCLCLSTCNSSYLLRAYRPRSSVIAAWQSWQPEWLAPLRLGMETSVQEVAAVVRVPNCVIACNLEVVTGRYFFHVPLKGQDCDTGFWEGL